MWWVGRSRGGRLSASARTGGAGPLRGSAGANALRPVRAQGAVGHGPVAPADGDQAGLDQLADGIRDRSFAEIYSDVESFARLQPVTVAAGAVLAGFLLARFIKSSADELAEASHAARAQAAAQQRSRAGTRPAASTSA
jgi:hypothetical protein